MDRSLIIREDQIAWTDNQADAVPLGQYAKTLVQFAERGEADEPIPRGVRFLVHRQPATLVVIEEPPHVRTVQWIEDESAEPFGDGAAYRRVSLAFPYVVILAVFLHGRLTTNTQCFYRTAPIERRDDRLYIPNLYNVDVRDDFPCWLCLKKLDGLVRSHSWSKKVDTIRRHFWGATFNRSASPAPGTGYWWKMKALDPRISSLDRWETASRENPLFPLHVAWTPIDDTLGDTMDHMLNQVVAPDRLAMTRTWLSSMPPRDTASEEAEP